MKKNKVKKIKQKSSIAELVRFFDNHDLGNYLENMPEVKFEVDIKRKMHLFNLNDDVANKLAEIAKSKRVTSEFLINTWLKEKIQENL